MTTGQREQLKVIARQQSEIAETLCGAHLTGGCGNSNKCLDQVGSYLDYDRRKMCPACEVYYLTDCARILIERLSR